MRLVSLSLGFQKKINVMSSNYSNRRAVPETPDAVLRPGRKSLHVGIESSKRCLSSSIDTYLTLQLHRRPRQW